MKDNAKEQARGFIHFIRTQGVIGLAIGFILGRSTNDVVSSFVADIVNPVIGLLFGSSTGLKGVMIGPIALGNFIAVVLDFVIIAAVVYFVFKGLKLDRLDVPKDGKK